MVDKVKPLKLESTPDGSVTDMYPVESNPTQDYTSVKGIAFENNDNRTIDLSAGGETQFKDSLQTTNKTLNSFFNQWFGSGNDGNVSLSSGTTTLTRDMFYNNLTLSSTAVLATNGFRIFVKGTLTIGASASITVAGANGTNAAGTTPGAAGAAVAQQTIGGGQSGSAGAAVNADSTGLTAVFGYGAAGGSGGAGGGNAGPGAPGTYTFSPEYGFREDHFTLSFSPVYKQGGGGGTGGNGGSQALFGTAGTGGGGGGGGGVCYIFCKTLDNSGTITAKGGNGGNGSAASAGGIGGSGGGGGGGGAGGGFIYILSHFVSSVGTLIVSGGTAGTGAAGAGGGAAGANGTAGSSGHYTIYNISTDTWTIV